MLNFKFLLWLLKEDNKSVQVFYLLSFCFSMKTVFNCFWFWLWLLCPYLQVWICTILFDLLILVIIQWFLYLKWYKKNMHPYSLTSSTIFLPFSFTLAKCLSPVFEVPEVADLWIWVHRFLLKISNDLRKRQLQNIRWCHSSSPLEFWFL